MAKSPANKTTEQVPTPPNPSGKGGFGDNPQNRNPGGWKKEESISYQYNKLMRMPFKDLASFKPNTVAEKIAYQRIKSAITTEGLNDTKEITDRTEGKAPQFIRLGDEEEYKQALVVFADDDDEDTLS